MKFYRFKKRWILSALAVLTGAIVVLSFYVFYFRAPSAFPDSTVVAVSDGKSLSSIASDLKNQNVIRSPFWFVNFVLFLKHERRVVAGEYYFDYPVNVYEVARKLTKGDFNVAQLKTTIPEGSTAFEISNIIKKNYPDFDTQKFLTLAQGKEGFLFPDTYKFGADVQPEKVISILTSTFDKKIQQQDIADAITASGRSVSDVIIMASILEGEARQTRTRQIVAGILWERIRLGIPLQVDTAFRYVNGKTTKDLTLADLKIDSPYNTYLYKGLTPTAISNPGLDSILSAVTPIQTEYLYFLTDDDGNMHYAETLEEHARNKNKYLAN
ncbi:MAG: endolytic transglycosylase MltG [Patescibacteria group bacterium]